MTLATGQPQTVVGERKPLGSGVAYSWLRTARDGSSRAIGVSFDDAALQRLGLDGKELVLAIPPALGSTARNVVVDGTHTPSPGRTCTTFPIPIFTSTTLTKPRGWRSCPAFAEHPGRFTILPMREPHTLHYELELANAASKAVAGGVKLSFRKNARASGAPNSRSIPESSHSTEIGPS